MNAMTTTAVSSNGSAASSALEQRRETVHAEDVVGRKRGADDRSQLEGSTLTNGAREFRNACRNTIARSGRPFARATTVYCSPSEMSIAERT